MFALWKWLRHGGYLIVRRSHFGWFPHFMWTSNIKDLEVQHFVPVNPKRKKLPPPLFRGEVVVREIKPKRATDNS